MAYILSSNVARRHLSKGQQAMAVACSECFATKQSLRQIASANGLKAPTVAKARVVLEFAPDLKAGVLLGSPSLDVAYEEARQRKEQAETDEAALLPAFGNNKPSVSGCPVPRR